MTIDLHFYAYYNFISIFVANCTQSLHLVWKLQLHHIGFLLMWLDQFMTIILPTHKQLFTIILLFHCILFLSLGVEWNWMLMMCYILMIKQMLHFEITVPLIATTILKWISFCYLANVSQYCPIRGQSGNFLCSNSFYKSESTYYQFLIPIFWCI